MARTDHATPVAAPPDAQTALYRLVAAISRPVVRAFFRPHVRGLEHLPVSGGFVLSANQLSNLDGFALAYPLYPRQPRWMGKAELFLPLAAPALRRIGVFPVRRGEGDLEAVTTAVELAREGHVVGIFPEGTRRRKGRRKHREARPHTGAARVALAARVPLVPAAIIGTERLTLLRRWRVAFGPPVLLSDLDGNRRLAARKATCRLWEAITELEAELQAQAQRPPRRLRPRHVLDVSLRDLLFALAACMSARRRGREERVLGAWIAGQDGLVCLSVRSGFDLLLQALSLAPGDEVAVSAVTHPDMVRVLEAHGLRALPVDLDPETLEPRPDLLEHALTARTRAVVVAHLFGSRAALEPLAKVARRHGLLLVEDCAQSFRGPDNAGDQLADVSLFSFGPIKTATALGGALVRVRDAELRRRMRLLQNRWPPQPRREYAARVVKSMMLVLLGRPRVYWVFARVLALLGRDLDAVVNGAVRGFPGPALVVRLRRRPSAPLLTLLERRLRSFDPRCLAERARLGERVAHALPPSVFQPGRSALDRTHWVFPVVTADRAQLIDSLRRAGFDAATATSNIVAVSPPIDRPDLAPKAAARMMARVVFLPVYPKLGEREVERLLAAVAEGDGDAR
jgi:perosamine synthetase